MGNVSREKFAYKKKKTRDKHWTEMQNVFDGLSSRLDTVQEGISEPEDIAIERE